jgi:cytochrome c oxidase subunit 2
LKNGQVHAQEFKDSLLRFVIHYFEESSLSMIFAHSFARRLLVTLAMMLAGLNMAFAAEGHPSPWQINFQDAVTSIAMSIHQFHNLVLVIITAVVLLVLVLLIVCAVRFRAGRNPNPSRTTHNVMLEVAWTILPVLILVVIAAPSFRLLFAQYDMPEPDMTIKATGHQWYWSYEYQTGGLIAGGGEVSFDSVMLKDDEIKDKAIQPRLLAVDNEVVVPVGKTVRVLVTAADVIHAFAVPSFGIKSDGVPGRINQTWFKADRVGVYYGQCSELCGRDHAFMPIAVRVVSDVDFAAWLAQAKQKFASAPAAMQIADAAH